MQRGNGAMGRFGASVFGSILGLVIAVGCSSGEQGGATADAVKQGSPIASCKIEPAGAANAGAKHVVGSLALTGGHTLSIDMTVGSSAGSATTIQLDGKVLYDESPGPAVDGKLTRTQNYYAPFGGVHRVETIADDKTIAMTIDGRATKVAAMGSDPKSMIMADGSAIPTLDGDPKLIAGMGALLQSAVSSAAACEGDVTPRAPDEVSSSKQALWTGRSPHPSAVDSNKCLGCEAGCIGAEAVCLAATTACGPFFWACAAGCIATFEGCQAFCHRSGTDCCPVDCGGASQFTTPHGACCESGETCLRKKTSCQVALCCSPGTTVCNGQGCCMPGDTCMNSGLSCPAGALRNGECCLSGVCSTRADCNGGDPNGPNGCNTNGCCVVG